MFKVIYEDNDILVADKPSGMAVHPSRLHQGDTLADEVEAYLKSGSSTPGATDPFVFRCITRLDKDTSGLVLIAKTLEAARRLNEAMVSKSITREYEALVEDDGSMPESGIIDAPIARASEDVHDIRRCVDLEKGERAVTDFRVIERGDGYARVSCTLETGRTHQIRVHMKYIGHPVKWDPLYNSPILSGDPEGVSLEQCGVKYRAQHGNRIGAQYKAEHAMGLRATRLSFPHPIKDTIMDCKTAGNRIP